VVMSLLSLLSLLSFMIFAFDVSVIVFVFALEKSC